MKVIKDLSIEIPGTNVHYFNLDEFSNDSDTESVLAYGYGLLERPNERVLDKIKTYTRKVYLNVTMPTEFASPAPTLQDKDFDQVYGICPYTVDWLNTITNSNKYKFIFYPFNKNDIPQRSEKKYDVCYFGGLHSYAYLECLNIMKEFNYRYVTMTRRINKLTRNNLKQATNTNLTNKGKLKLLSECKISICYNTFPIRNYSDIDNIKRRDRWEENEAFKHIDSIMLAPQFKSRFNEAAMCRTLNLIQRDQWNVVERFYVPGVDFVYFDSNEELEDQIRDILNNWDDYQPVIESAYNKSMNYTTEKLFEIINTDKYEL